MTAKWVLDFVRDAGPRVDFGDQPMDRRAAVMMPSTPQEWDAYNYRASRSHATAELLDAMAGIAPRVDDGRRLFGPRPDQTALRCGEPFVYAARVCALDVRPEITCSRCRALMRAIRPQSAPLHHFVICAIDSTAVSTVFYVGGEQVTKDEYDDRCCAPQTKDQP